MSELLLPYSSRFVPSKSGVFADTIVDFPDGTQVVERKYVANIKTEVSITGPDREAIPPPAVVSASRQMVEAAARDYILAYGQLPNSYGF